MDYGYSIHHNPGFQKVEYWCGAGCWMLCAPVCVPYCIAFEKSMYEFPSELIKSNEIRNRFVFQVMWLKVAEKNTLWKLSQWLSLNSLRFKCFDQSNIIYVCSHIHMAAVQYVKRRASNKKLNENEKSWSERCTNGEKVLFSMGKKSLTIKLLTFSFTSIKNYPHRAYRTVDCTVSGRYGVVWMRSHWNDDVATEFRFNRCQIDYSKIFSQLFDTHEELNIARKFETKNWLVEFPF